MSALVRLCIVSLILCALSACAAWQPAPGAPQARAAASGTCHAEPVQWAVGQVATPAVTGRVWRESHAGLIRPLRPEQTVGRDMRPDRVTLELDRDNTIKRVYCG